MNSDPIVYTHEQVGPWEQRLRKVMLVIARLALGYLFFTQLFWKLPPTFGCSPDFKFTTLDANGKLVRTQGLCDWIGFEEVFAHKARPFFVADPPGPAKLQVDLGFIAQANGLFLKNFVMPNIRWFGYIIWLMEAFIFVSLFFGLFSRLGALVALAQSTQLMIGLAGTPGEWEWSYNLMVALALLLVAFVPGRVFGIDALLRPRLQAASAGGNQLAKFLTWLT